MWDLKEIIPPVLYWHNCNVIVDKFLVLHFCCCASINKITSLCNHWLRWISQCETTEQHCGWCRKSSNVENWTKSFVPRHHIFILNNCNQFGSFPFELDDNNTWYDYPATSFCFLKHSDLYSSFSLFFFSFSFFSSSNFLYCSCVVNGSENIPLMS